MKKSTQTLFKPRLLKTEAEYDRALERLDTIFSAPPNNRAGQEV